MILPDLKYELRSAWGFSALSAWIAGPRPEP
jgi:hypothetical protein